jgi:hypothetical protein
MIVSLPDIACLWRPGWRCAMPACLIMLMVISAQSEELVWPSEQGSVEQLMSAPDDPGVSLWSKEEIGPTLAQQPFSEVTWDNPFSQVRWWNPESWLSPLEVLPLTIYGFTVADSWRGPSDGHFQNNDGFKKGITAGGLLPGLADYGVGGQIGASYALYDEAGRFSAASNRLQQQTFLTTGVFRHGTADMPISAGVVYDGMFNEGFGVFAASPYLSQLRVQAGCLVNDANELGFWCALPLNTSTYPVGGVPTVWRGVAQYNAYWHRNFQPSSGDLWMWIGVPDDDHPSGSLGELILGSYGSVAMNDYLQLYGVASYMMPSAGHSPAASTEDSFYVGFGIAVFVGPKARHNSVAGNPLEPYFPVADNGTFFVDTNRIQ